MLTANDARTIANKKKDTLAKIEALIRAAAEDGQFTCSFSVPPALSNTLCQTLTQYGYVAAPDVIGDIYHSLRIMWK